MIVLTVNVYYTLPTALTSVSTENRPIRLVRARIILWIMLEGNEQIRIFVLNVKIQLISS